MIAKSYIILTVGLLVSSALSLSTDSVVLITGAAGFVGSELALALHRTYSPKKIICVDSMSTLALNQTKEENLSLFDVKRQRAFHVMQILGKKGHFYRADFRPSIPEYFDVGEVPILDYIFRDHSDITHVVHLADPYHGEAKQAVPRLKQDIKAGMMEALLEQLRKVKDETGKVPQFVYASSYEVYNYYHPTQHNPTPFREDRPITTPSSLRGTSKLLDEIVARTYQEKYNIQSVGLRFFPVYGPWGVPGSPLYEMAERTVTDQEMRVTDDIRDYVYVDDAVDATMAAMQLRTHAVINVGSGQGTTLRDIHQMMMEIYWGREASSSERSAARTTAVASTDRAREFLGFEPQVSLENGLTKLLAWHYDRAFPYGPEKKALNGLSSCSPFDQECLHGAPVFPCASECAHETQCTTSYYDDVTAFTMSLTESCETVMYTLDLNVSLVEIPSAVGPLANDARSHLKDEHCNIAFVSEQSPLVARLKEKLSYPFFTTFVEEFHRVEKSTGKRVFLNHGFWTLVPLPVPSFRVGDEEILTLMPKLSPGGFFGEKTKKAIYCAPNVAFSNVNLLLEEAKMEPLSVGSHGGTALLVGKKPSQSDLPDIKPNVKESIQASAYRMIRIGIVDNMLSHPLLDTSWMVHSLQTEDARLFRCDVFQEVVQWGSSKDESAMEFVVGLHDMWVRVLLKDKEPWWIGDSVVTVRQSRRRHRRLLQEKESLPAKAFEIELEADATEKEGEVGNQDVADAAAKAELEGIEKVGELELDKADAQDLEEEEDDQTTGEDTEVRKPEVAEETAEEENDIPIPLMDRDLSGYDTWMGMLSSTDMHYFVRIVPSAEIGVVFLK